MHPALLESTLAGGPRSYGPESQNIAQAWEVMQMLAHAILSRKKDGTEGMGEAELQVALIGDHDLSSLRSLVYRTTYIFQRRATQGSTTLELDPLSRRWNTAR